MLVLTRREHDKIVVPFTAKTLRELVAMIPPGSEDDDVRPVAVLTVTVTEIRKDKARLGVDAPKVVPVHRQEVYEEIMKSHGNGEAAGDAA